MEYAKIKKRVKSLNKEVKSAPLPQKDNVFMYVESKYQDAQTNREPWVQKQIKYNKLRMRIKKAKTFPFVGCSNIRMPTAEIKIRKVKAALFNVVFGIRPIVQVVPPPNGRYETALKIEKFLDHLLMERMRIQNKSVITIDQMLEQGFYGNMPYWKLEITKRQETFDRNDLTMDEASFLYEGATNIDMIYEFLINRFDIDMDDRIADDNYNELTKVIKQIYAKDKFDFFVKDIVSDIPDIELISPERWYVPSDSGFDPQDNTCNIVETFMPYHQLKTMAQEYDWDIKGIEDIGEWKGKDFDNQFQREQNKDMQEGIDRLNSSSEQVRLWHYFGWYDLNGDGVKEKCVIICAPDFNKTLKKMALPLFSGKFPLVKFFYELTDNRWYAHRGIVEIAEDIIKEIDVQHNMKLDQQTIRNAPMFLYRAGQVNPNLIQMIPNQAIPIRGLQPLTDTVAVLNNTNPNVDFSYEREQQILESKLEELIGQIDYTLQSQINKRQPRTLGEVQLQAQNAQQVFALDAGMCIEQFTELFNQVWELWCQYGSDEYEFNYFGQNGDMEPIKIKKEEIQGRYKIVVRGNDRNTNPEVRIQKAQQIIQAAINPVFVQSGVIQPPQMIASLKRFYQYLEVENWEELVNLQWQPPPPPPAGQVIKPNYDSLPEGEQIQTVMSLGIQPDVQGRMMQKKEELLSGISDHEIKKSKGGGNAKRE